MTINSRIKNIIGNRYERLVVIEFSHIYKRRAFWKCLCDCGNESIICGKKLRNKMTKSCGCFRVDHFVKIKQGGLLEPGIASQNKIYRSYKVRAKERNLEFKLKNLLI